MFAISLVLVISCEPVNVETESRNFSALEVQAVCAACLEMAIKQASLLLLAYVHRDITVLIDG